MTDRAYARISLDNERSGSIAKQKAGLTRAGSADIKFYVDESVSGSKIPFAARPAGKQLLADLQPGDRVLVTKIDRAARNVRDLLDLVEFIDSEGASIVFVDQNIDTSGPFGKFILTLLGAIAELEANIIGERRKESLAVFAQEGRHAVGAAPFGFMSVENPNGRGLVIRPHPEDGPLLKRAIERVLAGESYPAILEDLKLPLKKAGFSVLLRNPRLAGMIPDGDGVVMVNGLPRIDPEAALLSMAEWNRLRDYMQKPDRKPWAHQDGFGAVLHCSVCGMRLYKSTGGAKRPNNNAYKCGRAKHAKGDPSVSVQVARADEFLTSQFLDNWANEPEVVQMIEDDEAARLEAIALALVNLDGARAAQDAAVTDDEEIEAFQQYRAAKKALKEAEGMSVDRRMTTRMTGRTYGEAWVAATDDAERCHLIAMCLGPATVFGGQRPIEQKIVWPVEIG